MRTDRIICNGKELPLQMRITDAGCAGYLTVS
jgi:hypothetical protein